MLHEVVNNDLLLLFKLFMVRIVGLCLIYGSDCCACLVVGLSLCYFVISLLLFVWRWLVVLLRGG